MWRAHLIALLSLTLSSAGCEGPPATKPPAWCTARGQLKTSCSATHCVAAVVVDYKRLEPRGYRVFSLEGKEVDSDAALDLAIAHLTKVKGAKSPDSKDVLASGDFFNCFLSYTNLNEWLVVVHRYTGQILFAEPQLWGDPKLRGRDFPLPDGFADATALGCDDTAGEPGNVKLVSTGQPIVTAPPSTPKEAWEIVQGLNITSEFTRGRPYRAMVISYAPAIGEFDVEATDWYAFIYRVSP